MSVLDENLRGIILRISDGVAVVRDEFGFDYSFSLEQLILEDSSLYDGIHIKTKPEGGKKKRSKPNDSAHRLDLHFERLVSNPREYPPDLRLWIQRDALLRKIEWCRTNAIPDLLIIHGIGDGILQKMVHETLAGMTGIEIQTDEILYHQSASVRVFFR